MEGEGDELIIKTYIVNPNSENNNNNQKMNRNLRQYGDEDDKYALSNRLVLELRNEIYDCLREVTEKRMDSLVNVSETCFLLFVLILHKRTQKNKIRDNSLWGHYLNCCSPTHTKTQKDISRLNVKLNWILPWKLGGRVIIIHLIYFETIDSQLAGDQRRSKGENRLSHCKIIFTSPIFFIINHD